MLKDPAGVIAASMQHGAIPFDENHATETASLVGGAAPARGWIDRMELRDDGIWGHVDWTEGGRALMTEKAYRWLSPVLKLDRSDKDKGDKTILAVTSVGLTNNPNLIHDLKAMQRALTAEERRKIKPKLFAVPEKEKLPLENADHVKDAWREVGSTEGLTDSERAEATRRIRARAKELGVDTSGWAAQAAEGQMEKKAICAVLGIPETMADDAVLVALQTAHTELQTARTENARLAAEVETMKTTHVPVSEVTALQTRLGTIETEAKQAKAVAFVDEAIKAGKPIAGAVRENYIAMHVKDAAGTETLVNALPSLNVRQRGGAPAQGATSDDPDVAAMSAEDRAVCSKMGLDPKAFVEMRKKMKGKA